MLAHAGEAGMLAALFGFVKRRMCTKSGVNITPCWENTPSPRRALGLFAPIDKSTLRRFLHAKYNSNPSISPRCYQKFANFWGLSAFHYANENCIMRGCCEYSSKLLPNFQDDRRFLTKCSILAVYAQKHELRHYRASCRAIRSNELSKEIFPDSKVR